MALNGRVLVTGSSVDEEFLKKLRDAGLEVDNPQGLLSEDELRDKLNGAAAYLLGGDEAATAKALESANDLKVIAYLGVGYQTAMDVGAARAKGIAITNTPGAVGTSTAELTVGHLLNLRRTITPQNNMIKHGLQTEVEKSHELAGKRLGIIGLGGTGKIVARIASLGLGMDVVYFSRSRKPELEAELNIKYLPFDELLKTSDAVVVMVPLNDETKGMIGARELGMMKDGALLINTARPLIVDPRALKDALDSGKLAGAAMDNYYVNPFPAPRDDPYGLLGLPDSRFIVTAWTGSLTFEGRNAMAAMAVDSIINVLSTGQDEHIVTA